MNRRTFLTIWAGLLSVATLTGCDKTASENTTQWPLVKECSLHQQACTAQQGDASATLKISPHPIPIAKPLGIEVALNNLNAQKVELDISGLNMYMGYNRVTLMSTKPNYYVGTSMLAFCTSQKMQWQITLMIHQPDGTQIQIPYYLETINR
ncbi:hypothetical protein QCB44_00115 [Thiomicrorhabdus sp. zzn3]|uniref:hypothetical protein n=1 Tax=Thiomicrorhabdus sp. zzn3 TaxID=3039775 RepID=UPI0024368243|nr:hypothetical protein [Thiomicrorhabdus sp. zzn3]MDG6777100.1 hypothetical protein [Thiomicrorhabdus sp. zzn3]